MDTPRFRSGFLAIVLAAALPLGVAPAQEQTPPDMNAIAEQYVRLVLALGQHDADYVDAYYGPPEWQQEAVASRRTLAAIGASSVSLRRRIAALPAPADEASRLRSAYLDRQLAALQARVRILEGERLSFDEESEALYDAVAPSFAESRFEQLLAKLESRFPGEGAQVARYEAWRQSFVVPKERLDAVFRTAIEACRARTVRHLALPAGESFTVEFVTGKSWSGYNWYQGGYRSLIQVNTDFPTYIDRALDLACHEGYPGHHVYNVLLEKHLVRDRGWIEFTAYPLFSPQSLIAEGTANYGIEMAFPGEERLRFMRDVLFPAAGLDPTRAEEYLEVEELLEGLSYAGNEAARRYLDGAIDADAAASWLERYTLTPLDRARQRVRFIEQYRSYVINYNLGKDLVRRHIEARTGVAADPDGRWEEFGALLSSARLPSGLTR